MTIFSVNGSGNVHDSDTDNLPVNKVHALTDALSLFDDDLHPKSLPFLHTDHMNLHNDGQLSRGSAYGPSVGHSELLGSVYLAFPVFAQPQRALFLLLSTVVPAAIYKQECC